MVASSLLHRLRGWLADCAQLSTIAGLASGSRAFMTLGSNGWGAPAVGLRSARSAALARLPSGGSAVAATATGSGKGSVPSSGRQHWSATAGLLGRRRRLTAEPGAGSLATRGSQQPSNRSAGLYAAAAAEPAMEPSASPTSSVSYDTYSGLVSSLHPLPPPPPPLPPAQGFDAAAELEAALFVARADANVEGTVQRITFRADDTGYTVLRLKLNGDVSGGSSSSSAEVGAAGMVAAAAAAEGGVASSVSAAAPAGAGKQPARTRMGRKKTSSREKNIITVVGKLPQVTNWLPLLESSRELLACTCAVLCQQVRC